MSAKTFECESCGQTFECGWTEEEQRAEAAINFPGLPEEDAATICDDCFHDIMARAAANPKIAAAIKAAYRPGGPTT